MKLIIALALLLLTAPAMAATPMTWQDANGAQEAMQHTIIERGNMPDGRPTVHVKWKINYGFIASWCSITLASEFLDVLGPRTLREAFLAPTPSGSLWIWNSITGPPAGINPWCTQ